MTQLTRPTIRDVAAAAEVSAQTVSRVVNNRPDVSPETRARVERVIGETGYLPNVDAQALAQARRHRAGTSGKALPDRGREWVSPAVAQSGDGDRGDPATVESSSGIDPTNQRPPARPEPEEPTSSPGQEISLSARPPQNGAGE